MKTSQSVIALALGFAMVGFGANAQTTQGASRQPTQAAGQDNRDSRLNQEDRSFLENAIQGSYAEVEASQLALDKSESQDVRDFAQAMVKDHGEMIKEATKLANDKGVNPPDGPSAVQTTEITGLRALTGGAFDAMYVNRIGVASHEATVEMFEEAVRQAQDPDIKAMATKTLPKLRHHLDMARTLDAKQEN